MASITSKLGLLPTGALLTSVTCSPVGCAASVTKTSTLSSKVVLTSSPTRICSKSRTSGPHFILANFPSGDTSVNSLVFLLIAFTLAGITSTSPSISSGKSLGSVAATGAGAVATAGAGEATEASGCSLFSEPAHPANNAETTMVANPMIREFFLSFI